MDHASCSSSSSDEIRRVGEHAGDGRDNNLQEASVQSAQAMSRKVVRTVVTIVELAPDMHSTGKGQERDRSEKHLGRIAAGCRL